VSCHVYANNRSVACKAADGKSIAAFPDVCFTPPLTPATPPGVPIPYPNTGMASDTTDGSKTVMISGKEVMLKDKSSFKQSTGDEAGSAPKKGVVTSKIKGKVNFCSWSMDVKFEGENVPRHLDLTGHNEASKPPNAPPWTYLDSMAAPSQSHSCHSEIKRAQSACRGSGQKKRVCDSKGKCQEAMGCILVPKNKDKEKCCSPNNTGHHLIEDHWIRPDGQLMSDFAHLAAKKPNGRYVKPGGPYEGAPTMCANKSRFSGKHGIAHGTQGVMEDVFVGKRFTYGDGREIALAAHEDAYRDSGCSRDCIKSQLDAFYGKGGSKKMQTPTRQQGLKRQQRMSAVKRVYTDTM
jgi:hypothetical protein